MRFAVCCYAMMTVSFAPAAHANYLTHLLREFSLDTAGGGLLISLAFWGSMLAALFAGPWADRWGFKRPLVASGVLQVLGLGMVAFSSHISMAFVGSLLAGMGCGVVGALVPSMVGVLYPEHRARILNALFAFNSVGAVTGVLLIMGLFRLEASWRVGYGLMGAMILPYLFGFALLALPHASFRGEARTQTRLLLRTAPFLLLLVALLMSSATEVGVSMWAPSYAKSMLSATDTVGATIFLVYCLAGVAGKFGNAWLSARIAPRRLLVLGGAVYLAGLTSVLLAKSIAVALIGFGAVALGMAGFIGMITAHAGHRYPSAGASMYSALNLTASTGSMLAPLLIGIAGRHSLQHGLVPMAVAPAISVGVMVGLMLAFQQQQMLQSPFNIEKIEEVS